MQAAEEKQRVSRIQAVGQCLLAASVEDVDEDATGLWKWYEVLSRVDKSCKEDDAALFRNYLSNEMEWVLAQQIAASASDHACFTAKASRNKVEEKGLPDGLQVYNVLWQDNTGYARQAQDIVRLQQRPDGKSEKPSACLSFHTMHGTVMTRIAVQRRVDTGDITVTSSRGGTRFQDAVAACLALDPSRSGIDEVWKLVMQLH